MAEKAAVQKVMVKAGDTVVFFSAPVVCPGSLGTLPDQVTILYEPSQSAGVTQFSSIRTAKWTRI